MKMFHSVKVFSMLGGLMLLSASCGLLGNNAGPAGVIKTVNGGVDWQFSNAISGEKTLTINNLSVSRMMFAPQNRETVFVGGYNGGLYKSTDSGATWKNILSKILVYNFAISPADSNVIYVSGMFDNNGKVLKTTDGGATWQEIYNEAIVSTPVRSIALNPSNPNQVLIGTEAGSLISSMDGGLSWKLWTNTESRVNALVWRNDGIYMLLRDKGLAKADSVGGDIRNLMGVNASTVGQAISAVLTGQSGKKPQAFNQAYIDTVSSSLMYVTTDVGLFKSSDSGKTWNYLPLPTQSGNGEARAIAVSNASSNVVITSIGNTIYKSTDGGNSWQTQRVATTGFINYILIDPNLPQIVYGGVYGQ